MVDEQALLTLMQYRSKAFNESYFEKKLSTLSALEREQLINDYVREEALYREAIKLDLYQDDYIIKRRMMQKVDFIFQSQIEQNLVFPKDSMTSYFEENKKQYRIPSLYTFSHVFFREKSDALSFLKSENTQSLTANTALKFGERFLYHRLYVEKDVATIKSHFGGEFVNSIQGLMANASQWQGPLVSEHGYHLVLLTQKKEGILPEYETVRLQVTEDYKREYERQLKDDLIQSLVGQYEIIVDL